jgi:hypothetical protein
VTASKHKNATPTGRRTSGQTKAVAPAAPVASAKALRTKIRVTNRDFI